VKTPLAEAGLTKNDVRRLSNNLNLPNWDKHSSSCLATRVAAGQHINEEKLGIIKKCEAFLHALDFQGCRVRMAYDHVIIELQEKDIERFSVHEIRLLILKKFNDFNLKRVFLDLHGRKERGS
jgi:uncharacterized protein